MLKKTIANKLFLILIVLFAAIFMGQIVFQSLFFESFYVHSKKQDMEEMAQAVEAKINNHEQADVINEYISQITEKNNTVISVIDEKKRQRYGLPLNSPSYIGVKTSTGKEYKMISNLISFDSTEIKVNDDIVIEGTLLSGSDSLVSPITVRVGGRIFGRNEENSPFTIEIVSGVQGIDQENTRQPTMITIEGKIVSKPSENKSFNSQKNVLFREIGFNMGKTGQSISKQLKTVQDSVTGINTLLLIAPIEGTDMIMYAVTTLQSVNEVIGNLNQYYFLLFVVTMILVAVIAIIFSRTLSRPLIKMSAIANKIANQDFSDKYVVKSQDELGQMGEALNKISTNLERKIAELTDAHEKLAEDYDIQMKLKIQEKEFTANISHELKTPLTVINGYIKGIEKGVYQANDTKTYDAILQEVNRMTDMIQEMLDISRLESPNFHITESTFDLWHVFLRVYDKFKTLTVERGLELRFDIDEEVFVVGDSKRIEQVISNLFMNAVKYTPKNSHINVNIRYNNSQTRATFTIENENARISDEEIERIWEPFYRIEKSRNKEYGGTGLGLAIVKQILDLHHSSYGVCNSQKGVEFYFDLRAISMETMDDF